MNILDKARKDKRIASLLNELSRKVKIKHEKNRDEGWGSRMENGVATIFYSGCKHPSASLAHELLHIDTQLKGYKRIRRGTSSLAAPLFISNYIMCLDNELQHHKFYQAFLALGFMPEQFYRDSDAEIVGFLRKETSKYYSSIIELIPNYFTVIAPGGSIDTVVIEKLKNDFLNIDDGCYKEKLLEIEEHVKNWSLSESYDNVQIMKDIMLTIQKKDNLTWFGFNVDDMPPTQGFFVNEEFSIYENGS